MWFIIVCTLTDNEYVSLLVLPNIFSYCFCILSEFLKVFGMESLTRILHNAARALSSPSWCFQLPRQIFISIIFDTVVKNKSNVI